MSDQYAKVVMHEVFVRNPPGWFRKIGDGPWESVSLEPYSGMLPVVWLKPDVVCQQTQTWVDAKGAKAIATDTVREKE